MSNSKLSAKDFFAKPNQLFKVLKVVEGNLSLGHRSKNLNVITECKECGQQREERADSTNFMKCLRCRSTYNTDADKIVPPTTDKEIAMRDDKMLKPAKILIKSGDEDSKPEETVVEKPKRKRVLRTLPSDDDDEEEPAVTTTTTTTTTTAVEEEEEEEPLVATKPKKSLKDFAKDSLEQIVCKAGDKTIAEMEANKRSRTKGNKHAPDDVIVEDISDDLIVKNKNHRAIDVSKSLDVDDKDDLPVVQEETFKVVRLKKGQTFMHQGIMFIAE